MVTTEVGSTGRLKRIAQAARNADALVVQAGDLTTGVNATMLEVSDLLESAAGPIARIDPMLQGVDAVLDQARAELDSISDMRRDVSQMLARVNALLDLVEWAARPVVVARERLQSATESARQTRTTWMVRLRIERKVQAPAPRPADLRLAS